MCDLDDMNYIAIIFVHSVHLVNVLVSSDQNKFDFCCPLQDFFSLSLFLSLSLSLNF